MPAIAALPSDTIGGVLDIFTHANLASVLLEKTTKLPLSLVSSAFELGNANSQVNKLPDLLTRNPPKDKISDLSSEYKSLLQLNGYLFLFVGNQYHEQYMRGVQKPARQRVKFNIKNTSKWALRFTSNKG